jgi:MFS family permease
MTRTGRRFFLVAAAAGFVFTNMAVAVPLHTVESGRTAATAGNILAISTLAIALGAASAGAICERLRGAARLLAAAPATMALGALLLAAAGDLPLLTLGAGVVGFGIGLFWVASQVILSAQADETGSAAGFSHHYASYTAGGVVGSILTGAAAPAAHLVGFSNLDGIRASSVLAAGVVGLALLLWRPLASPGTAAEHARGRKVKTLALQVPDLLLVGALALLLPLAPVVLAHDFRLPPFSIGLVMAGVALSKITGILTARLLVNASGTRRTIFFLLVGGSALSLLLCIEITVSLFVMLLFATALVTTGAWPLVVASAQSRVDPEARRTLTVAWNTREYVLIATMTAVSGWLLSRLGSSAPAFVLAALMFGLAAAAVAVPRLRRRHEQTAC